MKKIGLFGGSFDPIHKGHIEVAKSVLRKYKLDKIYFILSYSQPFNKQFTENFLDRAKLVEIAIKDFKKFSLSTIEKDLPTPSYTYNTVKYFQKKYQSSELYFIIGDDQIKDLDKWHQIDKLEAMVEFIVAKRENKEIKHKYKYVDVKLPQSSTLVKEGNFNFLDYNVLQHMFKNNLYLEEVLKNYLSEKRYNHSLRVRDVALEIGQYYNVDLVKLALATTFHDIAKELDDNVQLEIMTKYFKEYLNKHPKVYHQYTSAYIAKKQLNILDQDVLNAIKYHTTGEDKSLLGMLTYVADKVERGRSYPVEHYIKLSKKNIYQAFKVVKSDAEAAILKKKGKNTK